MTPAETVAAIRADPRFAKACARLGIERGGNLGLDCSRFRRPDLSGQLSLL